MEANTFVKYNHKIVMVVQVKENIYYRITRTNSCFILYKQTDDCDLTRPGLSMLRNERSKKQKVSK